MQHNGYVN